MKAFYSSSIFIACMFSLTANGQVNDPGKVVAADASNHANNDINNAAESGLNKAESGIKGLFKKKNTSKTETAANVTAPAPSLQPAQGGNPASIKSYSNYDFVPGDTVLFEDHFTDDRDGEFPSHWDLKNGQATLNKIGDDLAFLFTDGNYCRVTPLMKSPSYLSDNFTIEYDVYGNQSYPLKVYFYSEPEYFGDNNMSVTVAPGSCDYSVGGSGNLSAALPPDIREGNFTNRWHHIAIAYRKQQMKVYVDQYRVLVIPHTALVPVHFELAGIGDQKEPIVCKNMRIANGGNMNMLGKKFTDAKIITHGINFDIDKATLKPESMGTLNMIASVLKDNPAIKFEIDGHTDNSGTSAHNLQLSQQRSEAVKNQLISMGIDAARLTSKGLGDTKPISDNNSFEGKANNRRVEFVKL